MTADNVLIILARLIAIHEGASYTLEEGKIFSDDWAAVFVRGENDEVKDYIPGKNYRAKAEQFYELWMTMKEMTE